MLGVLLTAQSHLSKDDAKEDEAEDGTDAYDYLQTVHGIAYGGSATAADAVAGTELMGAGMARDSRVEYFVTSASTCHAIGMLALITN